MYHSVNQMDKELMNMFKWIINQTMFSPTEYHDLKEFYNNFIKKYNESVVLKKI